VDPRRHSVFRPLEPLAFGFSLVYRRSVAELLPFPHIDRGEDLAFARAVRDAGGRIRLVGDAPTLVEHRLHGDNISKRARGA
jgi:hypothetical protein